MLPLYYFLSNCVTFTADVSSLARIKNFVDLISFVTFKIKALNYASCKSGSLR